MKKLLHKLNEKSKKVARYFFLETKLGIWLMASMAVLNAVEGIVHLVVALIGTWGGVDTGVTDGRVWLPVVENFILGIFSLLTGWCLGIAHSHNHEGGHHH